MTRDQAAQIIARAIVAAGPHDQILGSDAFAQRTATALDALGILAPLTTSNTQERSSSELLRSYPPDHPVQGDLGSIPL
jgi:hypothetical protein